MTEQRSRPQSENLVWIKPKLTTKRIRLTANNSGNFGDATKPQGSRNHISHDPPELCQSGDIPVKPFRLSLKMKKVASTVSAHIKQVKAGII